QLVGAARTRRPAGAGAQRGRVADLVVRPGHAGRAGPGRGPDPQPPVDLLRPGRGARAVRGPLLPVRTVRGDLRGALVGVDAGQPRDAGRDRGAAVLQPRRVAVVRRPGLDADRDDRPARGGPGP